MKGKLTPPFRTVLLLQDLEFGGTQRYAVQLLKHLDRNLFSPELWVLRGGKDMLPLAEEAGVKIFFLSLSPSVGPRALVHLFWRLMRHRPDILYTLTGVPNIWGRPFGTIAGVPVIITSWRGLVEKQWESILWPLSTRIVCNAYALKGVIVRLHSVDPSRIAVVPNAVPADFFFPSNGDKAAEPTVLYVGRLVPEKDLFTLLEGFRLTLQRIPNARLNIVGNGRLKGKLEDFIRRNSLQPSVRLLPGRNDIRPLLRQAWVFVMTSISEASPNVILEAMATELPVVGTRVGGIPELVQDGDTGIVVHPENPQGVADALTRLLDDEDVRRHMGRKGRERVLAFHTMERMIEQTQRVLIEAVNEAAQSKRHQPKE
jgi:glycosyltransferase involved in cell wall biosynthesis